VPSPPHQETDRLPGGAHRLREAGGVAIDHDLEECRAREVDELGHDARHVRKIFMPYG